MEDHNPKQEVVYLCTYCGGKKIAPRGEWVRCRTCGRNMDEKAEVDGKQDGTPWRAEEFQ